MFPLGHEGTPGIHETCYWPNYLLYNSNYGPHLALHKILIKITSVLGILVWKFLILTTDYELVDGFWYTMEEDVS